MSAEKSPVIRDFTIPIERYPHLLETNTLHDAVKTLTSFSCGENDLLRYSTLFIIDEQNRLVGKTSLLDLLKALDKRLVAVPKVDEFEGKSDEYPNLSILWEESFFIECAKKKNILLNELMAPVKRMLKSDDSLVKALSVLLHSEEQALPVIEDNSIIGVIRLEEIFKAVCSYCKL